MFNLRLGAVVATFVSITIVSGAQTWESISSLEVDKNLFSEVEGLVMSAEGEPIVSISEADGVGVYKVKSTGFEQIHFEKNFFSWRMEKLESGQVVICGDKDTDDSKEDLVLLISDNQIKNWKTVSLLKNIFNGMIYDVSANGKKVVATGYVKETDLSSEKGVIFVSEDSGETWSEPHYVSSSGNTRMRVAVVTGEETYAAGVNSVGGKDTSVVLKLDGQGNQFTQIYETGLGSINDGIVSSSGLPVFTAFSKLDVGYTMGLIELGSDSTWTEKLLPKDEGYQNKIFRNIRPIGKTDKFFAAGWLKKEDGTHSWTADICDAKNATCESLEKWVGAGASAFAMDGQVTDEGTFVAGTYIDGDKKVHVVRRLLN